MASWASGDGAEIVVWGSSTGWLVFYAALGLGARSRGVELLEPLHTVARAQALKHASVLRGRAHLECGDCLRSDASRAAAVVLASQCWDDELCARVAVKLAAELPVGAAVVDYRREALAARQEFALVHVARLPVSWNASQPLYCFVRQ